MDDGVQLAHRAHRQAGVERLTRPHHREPLGDRGRVLADLRRDRLDRQDRGVGRLQMRREVVVRVLVGDQHGVDAVDGGRVGEHAGIDDDRRAVVLDPDAGVAELGDPHAWHRTASHLVLR